jgi:hypothetical protein
MFDVVPIAGDGGGNWTYRLGELVFSFLEKNREVRYEKTGDRMNAFFLLCELIKTINFVYKNNGMQKS